MKSKHSWQARKSNVQRRQRAVQLLFEQISPETPWTSYYDEPTRKVKYKYEDGLKLVSCLSEAIIDAPLIHVLSLFGEMDMFKDWFPNVTDAKIIHKVTEYRGMHICKQNMQWPMWPRDMIFQVSGMYDRKNLACLSVLKSLDEGETFFNIPAPKTAEGHVRIDIKRGYHYFQRIDDNKTRYVTIFNTDPKLQLMPNWFMNFVMTKICYKMLVLIQKKSLEVPNNAYGERIKTRREFYGKIEDQLNADIKASQDKI
eukprot:403373399